ncbi:hypothetical protein BB561_001837 [Smittium simulii]|uniref:Uncharacterized protein n=1 Tax=Smittium simulii TaxID=133385 RepID=A0A2T9YT10_9FUNG|nr:hypothetical protein BB561_001837 [Smittium simulii]
MGVRIGNTPNNKAPGIDGIPSELWSSFEIDVKESHSYTFPTVQVYECYKAEIKFKKRRRRTDSERRALPTNSVNDTNQIRQLILWQCQVPGICCNNNKKLRACIPLAQNVRPDYLLLLLALINSCILTMTKGYSSPIKKVSFLN